MRCENWHGFVAVSGIDVQSGGAVQVEYRRDGRWVAACVFPNLTEEELQSPCNDQDWNWATQFHGLVHGYQIRDRRVYWNYVIDFDGVPTIREQELRVRQCGDGGRVITEETVTVVIDPGDTVILNDWHSWNDVRPEIRTVGNWRTADRFDCIIAVVIRQISRGRFLLSADAAWSKESVLRRARGGSVLSYSIRLRQGFGGTSRPGTGARREIDRDAPPPFRFSGDA